MFGQKRVSSRLAALALGKLILQLDHPKTYGLGRSGGTSWEWGVLFMQQLNVKLRRNHQEQNWSVEINDKSYEFISIEEVDELVKRALINAQESLTVSDA
jgi:hypothetical protein